MKEKIKKEWNEFKSATKKYVKDVGTFAWEHPRTAGTVVGLGIVYLSIVIPGLTTHRNDTLTWVSPEDLGRIGNND